MVTPVMDLSDPHETRIAGTARRRARLLLLAVMCIVAQGSLAQEKPEAPPNGVDKTAIRVAVEGAYPPFNFTDQNNELQGFEVDLLKALCETMRATCTLVPHEWDGIIRGLLNHEYDAIMSSLEITERRSRRIAFSRRYYRIPAAFIAATDQPITSPGPEALAGKSIGIVDRRDHAEYLRIRYPQSEVRTFDKLEDADLDLLTGRLDFVLGDKLALSQFLASREGACCRFVADVPDDPALEGRGYGIGLRKEDEALKARFDKAIGEVMENGTYDRIREKYFPIDIK
jgi:polar amino acid transport system substrate-binding protein